MKRIILGLSVLLMLAQNGFAQTDAEYDKQIANEPDKVWKQIYRCNKEGNNHRYDGNIDVCLKAQRLIERNPYVHKEGMRQSGENVNIGILYADSKKNYIKAYEYYMKAAKLEDTTAQRNLDILCRKHSWVCK